MCQQELYSPGSLKEESEAVSSLSLGKDIRESEAEEDQVVAEGRSQPEEERSENVEEEEEDVSKRSYAAALAKESSEKREAEISSKQKDVKDEKASSFAANSSSGLSGTFVAPAVLYDQYQAPLYPHCVWPQAMAYYSQGAVTSSVEYTYNQSYMMMPMNYSVESGQLQQDYWMNVYNDAAYNPTMAAHLSMTTQYSVPPPSAPMTFAPQCFYPYFAPHESSSSSNNNSCAVLSSNQAAGRTHGGGKQRYSPMKKDQSSRAGRQDGARGKASSYYAFNVEEARAGDTDARTTVMIKNIPNKYDQTMLLKVLDAKYKGMYDFFYLPIDFRNRCNLGYAFVNFIHSSDAADLYEEIHLHTWSDFNSKKVCEVTYARVQGQEALLEHFKNSKFPCDDINCLPLVIERLGTSVDGELNTRAVPIRALSLDTEDKQVVQKKTEELGD